MTNTPTDFIASVYGSDQQEQDFTQPLPGANFKVFSLLRRHPFYGQVIPWEIQVNELGGGYAQNGDYSEVYNKVSSATGEVRFPRTFCLPLATSTDSLGSNGTSVLASANVFSTLAIGSGAKLYKETSATDPTLVLITYAAGSNITALHPIVQGGVGTAENLLVCKAGAAPEILSDLVTGGPTSVGTMHANLNPTWGKITSYLNAANPNTGTNMFYANQSIYLLPVTSAYNAAPTAAGTSTVYPNGGWAVGIIQPNNFPGDRAFWVMPRENRTTSLASAFAIDSTTAFGGRVVHTNLEGTDPQEITGIPFWNNIALAGKWHADGMYLSNQLSLHFWNNSAQNRDLHAFANWPVDSDYTNRIVQVWPDGDDLYMLYSRTNNTNSASRSMGVEWYSWARNQWYRVSNSEVVKASAPYAVGRGAFSDKTRNMHWYGTPQALSDDFQRQYFPVPGTNPFDLRQVASSSGGSGAQAFSSPAVATLPVWTLPGLGGYPSLMTECDMSQCDIDSGGTGAIGKWEFATQAAGTSLAFSNNLTAQFSSTDPIAKRVRHYRRNFDAFNRLQLRGTITQGSSGSKYNMNLLPTTIRGMTFLTGRVVDPQEVIGKGWYR